jgi:FlaA1/EpsC-like NDP-sugar epimerase
VLWGRPNGDASVDGKTKDVDMSRVTKAALSLRVARAAAKLRSDGVLMLLDLILGAGAYAAVLLLRFEGVVSAAYWNGFGTFLAVALVVSLASNWLWGLYGRMWRHASVVEARRVLGAAAITCAILSVVFLTGDREMPMSVVVLGTVCASMFFGMLRFQSRLFAFRRRSVDDPTRVLVVGAGKSGGAMLREMLRDDTRNLHPVGVVDDDPRKQGLSLMGIPVVGTIDDLIEAATVCAADMVLLAIPSADGELVRRVSALADDIGRTVKILPSIAELVGGRATMRDVRDVSIDDLLGRQQVKVDLDAVRAILAGRRVLITGAGGSIGAEIARQVSTFAPESLVLLDHDETHLYEAANSIRSGCTQSLVDVRDADALRAAFAHHRPDVVFHAAAHKHVPILEDHPAEAVHTNCLGTENVVDVCEAFDIERLVYISTDKAVRPTSAMGASKRLGEHIVLGGRPDGHKWCVVRFGNVLGSRGSVIPTFMQQIAAGGPVTLTDRRMTRFFMSIPEAMQLVLQAATFAGGGEVFMLDMGKPVRIVDLAERMIRLSGREVGTDIVIDEVGIRPGEKLHEELRDPEDAAHPTAHPCIVALYPPTLSPDVLTFGLAHLRHCVRLCDHIKARATLFELATQRGTEVRVTEPAPALMTS